MIKSDRWTLGGLFKRFFLKEKKPFLKRQEINWRRVGALTSGIVLIFIFAVLMLPEPKGGESTFYERSEGVAGSRGFSGVDIEEDTLLQLQRAQERKRHVPDSTDAFFSPRYGAVSSRADVKKEASMIVSRPEGDSGSQLPTGTRVIIRLTESAVTGESGAQVVGKVIQDVLHDGVIAIPRGSRVTGGAVLEPGEEKVRVHLETIKLSDGREKPLLATGFIEGGQINAPVKNFVGHTLSRLIGAYAEGAMQRSEFGAATGGSGNGWKRAISETANDQAGRYAEKLEEERKQINLSVGMEVTMTLTEPYVYQDPGFYGR